MVSRDNNQLAERHIKFRILASTLIAFGLLASVANDWGLRPAVLLDYVNLLGWLSFAGTLMLILANGHDHLWSNIPGVGRLLGDDSTVENRRLAQGFGFWAGLAGGVGVALMAIWIPIPTTSAVQLVVTLALGAAALRFAILEQRALNP